MERVPTIPFKLRISTQILTKCQPEYHTNVMEHLELFVIHSMAKLVLLDLKLVVLPPLEMIVCRNSDQTSFSSQHTRFPLESELHGGLPLDLFEAPNQAIASVLL